MTETLPYTTVGQFGAVYGLKGWIKLISYTHPPRGILNYEPWYIEARDGWQLLAIDQKSPHGNLFVVHINGIDTPEAVKTYTGKNIGIPRNQLPKLDKNEYYWADLEKLTVINQDDQVLGNVDQLMSTGANDVLIVTGEKRHLIPFIKKQIVLDVDLEKKLIRVNWDTEF